MDGAVDLKMLLRAQGNSYAVEVPQDDIVTGRKDGRAEDGGREI